MVLLLLLLVIDVDMDSLCLVWCVSMVVVGDGGTIDTSAGSQSLMARSDAGPPLFVSAAIGMVRQQPARECAGEGTAHVTLCQPDTPTGSGSLLIIKWVGYFSCGSYRGLRDVPPPIIPRGEDCILKIWEIWRNLAIVFLFAL